MTIPYAATMTLSKHLVDTVVNQATGRSEPFCVGDRPRDRYFIGSLAPGANSGDVVASDLKTRLSPTAIGLDVLVQTGASTRLTVKPAFNVYYRVLPTLDQQLRAPIDGHPDAGDDDDLLGEESDATEDSRDSGRRVGRQLRKVNPVSDHDPVRELAIVFRKVNVELDPISVSVGQDHGPIQAVGEAELKAAIDHAIAEVRQRIQVDAGSYRRQRKRILLPPQALESEEAFSSFLAAEVHGDPVVPQWAPKIEVTVRPHSEPGVIRVSVMLRNDSEEDKDRLTDQFLFDARLELEVHGGTFRPMHFWQDPKNYRYSPLMPGSGQNCVVEGDSLTRVWTNSVPIHEQKKFVTRDRKTLSTRFADLAADPVPALGKIAAEMEAYHAGWKADVEDYRGETTYNERLKDLTAFGREVTRFLDGISAIRRFPLINQAFRLMNETFRRQGEKKGYNSWRLFQLVFIVMNVPDLAPREYPQDFSPSRLETVDVLWFPTGGGKTETYLGLVVFSAFFDRLRGKTAGVTAWTRFPLRLLSLQQLQRIADLVVEADMLREQTPEIATPQHKPFSVGYLVGKVNTPNNLVNYGDDQRAQLRENRQRMQRFKIITRCPYCQGIDPDQPAKRQGLEVQLVENEVRLVHKCMNPKCGKVLPIYVVDNEVYRYLPTVVVGTLDKLAALGNQRYFSHLFGAVTKECPDHGYLSLDECTQKYACKRKVGEFRPVQLKDPSPSLQIQDELHLLREGLGVFNSHYETFVDTFQQEMNNGARQKIIAATATIEEYQNHVYHLYRRQARRFPAPGPEDGESFYATTVEEEIRRYYVGIMPHQKSHINTIIDTLLFFHREVQELRKDPVAGIARVGLSLPVEDFLELLDKYEVSLTYVLSMKEGDRLTQSIRGQLADYLTRQGLYRLDSVSMTGNTPFDEVGQTLDRLERPDGPVESHVHSVVATSTISHGVDIARLNFMLFYGMPRQTAEYIQSSSRVGRMYCGIATVLFNPARERDQSHYHFFNKYHEFLDMLVEPVPINRWSKFSIRRTMTGLFMGLLLSYFMPRRKSMGIGNLYFSNQLRQAIEQRLITENEVLDLLFKAYGTNSREGKEFETEIKQKIKDIFYTMSNPGKKMTSEMLDPSPMMSLRDVDKPLVIRARGASDRLLDLLHDD